MKNHNTIKKIILLLIIFILLIPVNLYAQNTSRIDVFKKSLFVNTYIPYSKCIEIIKNANITEKKQINIKEYDFLLFEYLKNRFTITNNDVPMKFRKKTISLQSNEEIKKDGLRVDYIYKSKEIIRKIKFVDNEPNIIPHNINIYDYTIADSSPLTTFELNNKKYGIIFTFDISEKGTVSLINKEYLQNESELIQEEDITDSSNNDIKNNEEIIISSEKREGDYVLSDTGVNKEGASTDFLSTTIAALSESLTGNDAGKIFITFIFVFILGILHAALEAGHGKTILIAHLIDENKGFLTGVIFSVFMSLTHIIDIILIGIIFYFLSTFFDLSKYVSTIRLIGMIGLFSVALFMLIRAIVRIKKRKYNKKTAENNKTPIKINKNKGLMNTIGLAVLSGLAPCTFGWAIMLTIISINKLAWIFPIILVFGFGIFVVLISLSFVIVFIKNKSIVRINKIAPYMPIISALFLLCFSCYMIISSLIV